MTVTLINGHVLFAHQPNWSTVPVARRLWQTEIAETLPGEELRQALRSVPRRTLNFSVTPATQAERFRLETRLDAARLSGLACAALHGRGSALAMAATAGTNTLTLAATAWNWQPGDHVILQAGDQTFDVQEINGVAGLVLTLDGNLNFNWPENAFAWPLHFGQFDAQKITAIDGFNADLALSITELVSGRAVQIGTTPAHLPGVGEQVVGSTNTIG